MGKAAIELSGLHKRYRRNWSRGAVDAVRDMSLTVAQGEAFGFIGQNGAGKSTTIKMLMDLIRPTGGTASIFGIPVGRPDARKGLGYVPENPYLQDYLTPLEVLRMSLALHQVKLDDARSHCNKWLERLELGAVAQRPIRSFSKGMTQRVAIAQALCIKPRLLVLDEPLSGLDPVGRRDVVEIFSEYKKAGGTLFFTSHVLHDVERLADRFGLIHGGMLRAVSAPAELVGDQETVMVRSFGERKVEGMSEDFSGRWMGEVTRTDLWRRLEQLREAGHTLQEIRPTLTLEAAFMRAISEEHK